MPPEPAVTPGTAGSGVSSYERADVIRRRFTTRQGGVSRPPYDSLNLGGGVGDDPDAVARNRARVATAAGLPPERVVWMSQVHGTTVTRVTARGDEAGLAEPNVNASKLDAAEVGAADPTRPNLAECDGVVTAERGVALAVLVADCVPILAGDPVAGVIAAVHAGRRGAAAGIALRALDQMVTLGAVADRTTFLLGPAICGACYEVPASMRDAVARALPGSASTTDRGTPGLDLRAGLAAQLRAAGAAVVIDPRCTYTDANLFSHRSGAPTGRFAGLIWMPE